MSAPWLQDVQWEAVHAALANRDVRPVQAVLSKRRLSAVDMALLLSPGADGALEQLAQAANRVTRMRFGNALTLYAPLYVTNRCRGTCPYCGFKRSQVMRRVRLSEEEVIAEGRALRATGIQHVLLVAGDDPAGLDVEFLESVVRGLKELFPSVSVEIAPADTEVYRRLARAGVDGVTLYQETYDQEVYVRLHAGSPKADYAYRLDALSRAGQAGIRRLNVGALWGLTPWRLEALHLALHARYLERTYWRSQVLVGMPRLHHVPDDFVIPHPVSDADFCHIVAAMRLWAPDAGIVISTRERPEFRDHLPLLGATHFSAGSKTWPGGYSNKEGGAQFAIDDSRTPKEVYHAFRQRGFDPVFKDWDRGFLD